MGIGMNLLGVLLLAVSLSMDALGIGVSYGVRKIRVPLAAKVIICAISVAMMGLSILLGSLILLVVPPPAAKLLGALMLALLGVFVIAQAFWKREEKPKKPKKAARSIMLKPLGITIKIIRNPPSCDFDASKALDGFEALYLGAAMSVDSVGVGVSSAVMGLNTLLVPVTAGLFQMLFLSAGVWLGGKLSLSARLDSRVWTVISGLLLIGIAAARYLVG